MAKALMLRSCLTGNDHEQFWSGGGVSDDPADHNWAHFGSVNLLAKYPSPDKWDQPIIDLFLILCIAFQFFHQHLFFA
jgi:hypothetical protein